MKLVDGKSNTYINSSKEITDKDPKFKIGHIYYYTFAKGFVLNWPEEVFVITKAKNNIL